MATANSESCKNTEVKILQVRGFPFPGTRFFSKSKIESALDYRPLDDDIIICTYPKCGTNLIKYIVWQIINKDMPVSTFAELHYDAIPFLDITGTSVLENLPSPRAMHYHLTYHLIPKNSFAKYIYVFRNPKDALVSFYHFTLNHDQITMTFDDFFELFLNGNMSYGDYFDHVLSWYNHRHDPNVLLLSYEQLLADRIHHIFKLAKFLGEKYWNTLMEEESYVKRILENTAFDQMKKIFTGKVSICDMNENDKVEAEDEKVVSSYISEERKFLNELQYLRKGIAEDWKTHLSSEQNERIERIIRKKFRSTNIADFWFPATAEPIN